MGYRKQIDTSEELAKWYDEQYLKMGDGWNTPAEEINQHLDDLGVPFDKSKTLLDVGCGAGHFLAEAQKRVACYGIDISHQAIHYCGTRGVNAWTTDIASVNLKASPQVDYIVSMGSLEHVIDLDKALDNIRALLKPDGKFYFFCPNEKWAHFDQPNERAMSDLEWINLFHKHGLFVHSIKTWNDSTAFTGGRQNFNDLIQAKPPHGNKLNIGSGQRRFDTAHGWINVDCVSRPGQVPDLICDVGREKLPYPDNSMEYVVLHQVYEHFGLGEGHGIVKEAYRVLKPGGKLLITIPDLRALCQRWLTGQIDDYIFGVNLWGAFQGEETDRHKWIHTRASLIEDMHKSITPLRWSSVSDMHTWEIAGADIARSWWILGIESTK